GELHRHVAQPADADDAHAVGRFGMHSQGCENGHTTAQEWPSLDDVKRFRQRDRPSPVRTDVRRESAVMTDDGSNYLRAKMMGSRHALVTVHATARIPADADALAYLES